jgi:hypothetical protein
MITALRYRFAAAMVFLVYAAMEMGAQSRSDTIVKSVTVPRNRGIASLVSEMKIGGSAATADEYIFSGVQEVRPLTDGSLLVIDRGGNTSVFARVYDSNGKYVRTLGRYGEGPGEYTAPSGLGELPDGRILIRDSRGGRIAVFAKDGRAAQFYSSNFNGTSSGPDFITVGANGVIYVRMALRSATPGQPSQSGFVRLRLDGTVIDTIPAPVFPDVGPPALSASRTVNGGTSSASQAVPFAPAMLWQLSPKGYFVTANTGRYAIDMRIPRSGASGNGSVPTWKEGDPIVSIRRQTQPVAVNDAERAERRKQIEERLRDLDPGWNWTGPDIPRVKPPISSVRFGLDGRMWVQLSTPSERFDPEKEPAPRSSSIGGGGAGVGSGAGGGGASQVAGPRTQTTWREPRLFDLFEPDGTYVGQVGVPFSVTVLARKGDYVWGVTRDADDVQTLHRFRITWR